MPSPFAELRQVTIHADDGQAVLDGTSVSFRAGTWTALIGHDGGGKTTMLRLLMGLIHPSAGKVKVGGLDLARASYRQKRDHCRRTGYVFESTGLWANRTVFQNIALPLLYHEGRRVDDAVIDAKVQGIAEELGIQGSLHLPSHMADASVRKRTLIARALALDPQLLLCDEVRVGLAQDEALLVYAALRRRKIERQMTAVFAEHDADLEPFEVDQRWHIEEGRVLDRPSIVPPPDRRVDVRDSIAALGEASAMGPLR